MTSNLQYAVCVRPVWEVEVDSCAANTLYGYVIGSETRPPADGAGRFRRGSAFGGVKDRVCRNFVRDGYNLATIPRHDFRFHPISPNSCQHLTRPPPRRRAGSSEEHTSQLQSLLRTS